MHFFCPSCIFFAFLATEIRSKGSTEQIVFVRHNNNPFLFYQALLESFIMDLFSVNTWRMWFHSVKYLTNDRCTRISIIEDLHYSDFKLCCKKKKTKKKNIKKQDKLWWCICILGTGWWTQHAIQYYIGHGVRINIFVASILVISKYPYLCTTNSILLLNFSLSLEKWYMVLTPISFPWSQNSHH